MKIYKRKDLASHVKNIYISEVDCTVEHQICQQRGIRGYPTILLFYNGKEVNIVKFIFA